MFAGREQLLLEELDEAEIAEELAPLTAQLAFTQTRLGLYDDAAIAHRVRSTAYCSDPAHSSCS